MTVIIHENTRIDSWQAAMCCPMQRCLGMDVRGVGSTTHALDMAIYGINKGFRRSHHATSRVRRHNDSNRNRTLRHSRKCIASMPRDTSLNVSISRNPWWVAQLVQRARYPSPRSFPATSITLVTHATLARLQPLNLQCKDWPGPMSVALYLALRNRRIVYPPRGHASAVLQGATDVPAALEHIRYDKTALVITCIHIHAGTCTQHCTTSAQPAGWTLPSTPSTCRMTQTTVHFFIHPCHLCATEPCPWCTPRWATVLTSHPAVVLVIITNSNHTVDAAARRGPRSSAVFDATPAATRAAIGCSACRSSRPCTRCTGNKRSLSRRHEHPATAGMAITAPHQWYRMLITKPRTNQTHRHQNNGPAMACRRAPGVQPTAGPLCPRSMGKRNTSLPSRTQPLTHV